MKRLKTIFAIFGAIVILCAATVYINNNLVSIDNSGNIHTPGYLYYTPAHTKCVFRDSAVVITGGTNVQITNPSDSLFRELEAVGINWLLGDTAEVLTNGGYFVCPGAAGYGTNAVDWRIDVATKRAGVTTYSAQVIDFTTTGATNKNGGWATFYMEFEAGDKVWVTLTRLSGSGDFTVETAMFNLIMIYAE